MKPPRKRARMSTKKSKTQITDLNDDCIFTIFNMLSDFDICSTSFLASFTCKRMQELARDHYTRKHPDEWITIDISRNGFGDTDLELSEDNKNNVLKYFSKAIPNVRLRCPIYEFWEIDLAMLYYFLNNECHKEIRKLELDIGAQIDLNSFAEMETKEQLKNVEYVKITEAECIDSAYNGLVKHYVNLKHLIIANPSEESYDWLRPDYPKLETVALPWIDRDQPMNVQNFFERHPKLKDITCESFHIEDHILQNFENIHRLAFRCWSPDVLRILIDLLKCNDNNKSIKSFGLKLGFSGTKIEQFLAELNELQPIRQLEFNTADRKFLRIPYLEHLENLKVNVTYFDLENFIAILKNAPNLKMLEINADSLQPSWFKSISLSIIQELPKLRKFLFFAKAGTFDGFIAKKDLIEMENIRKSTLNASDVEFHISYRRKANDAENGEPRSMVSPGKVLRLNYEFKPELTKLNEITNFR